MAGFPPYVVEKSETEALQYLLTDNCGTIMPTATSAFWADSGGIYCSLDYKNALARDVDLFGWLTMPCEEAAAYWREYYECAPEAAVLAERLIEAKIKGPNRKITLGDELLRLFPESGINPECVESLGELNIYIRR